MPTIRPEPLPHQPSSDPDVLRRQLQRAAGQVEGGESAVLHDLIDGATHHLLSALVRGDKAAVHQLADAIGSAAGSIPPLSISSPVAALYRLAVLPRAAEAVLRHANGAALAVKARMPEGAVVRQVLAVLKAESDGKGEYLRRREVYLRHAFDVSEERVGQVLAQLCESGWLVKLMRNIPGPSGHYALSPIGHEWVERLQIREVVLARASVPQPVIEPTKAALARQDPVRPKDPARALPAIAFAPRPGRPGGRPAAGGYR